MYVRWTPTGRKQFALEDDDGKVIERSDRRRELVAMLDKLTAKKTTKKSPGGSRGRKSKK